MSGRGGSHAEGTLRQFYDDRRMAALLLALIVFVAYLPAILGAHFHFDDFHSLRDNTAVRTLSNIPRFFVDPQLWSAEPGNAMYRPTLLTTFALDHAAWGYRAPGWVLTNVLLHIGVSILTMALGRRLGLSALAAFLAGAVTALHPIHSEVVNYVSSRSESVSALLMLSALHLHLSARERAIGRAAPFVVGACLLFALSLTAKETTALFFMAVAALEWFVPLRRDGVPARAAWQQRAVRAATAFVVYGAVFIAVMWLRSNRLGHATADVNLLASRVGADPQTGGQLSIVDNILTTQSRVVVEYFDLLLRPVRLSVDHDVSRTFEMPGSAYVAMGIHLLLAAGAVVAWRRGSRLIPLAFLWFWLFLAPSVAFPLNVVMNEHRMYLPGIAIALLGGAGLARVASLLPARRAFLCGLPLVLFFPLIWSRSREWGDDVRLWTAAVERAPKSARAWQHLGAVIHAQRNDGAPGAGVELIDQALACYLHSVELFPASYDTQLNIGLAYLQRGQILGNDRDLERALAAYQAAENALGIKVPRTQLLQARVLIDLGRIDEALAIIRAQKQGDGSRTKLYDDMEARALRKQGDRAGAAAAMGRVVAIEREQDLTDAMLTLAWWKFEDGDVYGARDLIDEAMTTAKRAKGDFRPFLYAARMLHLLGIDPREAAGFLKDARTLGWSAPDDEVLWIRGGATPGAIRIGTRALPTYGDLK